MEIKAKFKGADGSLGYKNGENYRLNFKTNDEYDGEFIEIHEIDMKDYSPGHYRIRGGSYCRYQSLKAFLNNWQVLS